MKRNSNHSTIAGERLKANKLALLEACREVYVRRGRRALLSAMLAGNGTASADDVYAAVELSPGIDPRCLGSVPGMLAYRRIIRPSDFIKSTRPERHASYIQLWELADRAAAERWLADHPDLPDPMEEREGVAVARQGLLFDQKTTTPTDAAAGAGK